MVKFLKMGNLDVNLGPQEKQVVTIPFKKPEIKPGVEYRLLVSFLQKEKTLWADPGFEIAWNQLDLAMVQTSSSRSKRLFQIN